jgi:hypothetical protein
MIKKWKIKFFTKKFEFPCLINFNDHLFEEKTQAHDLLKGKFKWLN